MAYLMSQRIVPAGATMNVGLGNTTDTVRYGAFAMLLLLGGGFAWLVNAAYKEKEEELRAKRLQANRRGRRRRRNPMTADEVREAVAEAKLSLVADLQRATRIREDAIASIQGAFPPGIARSPGFDKAWNDEARRRAAATERYRRSLEAVRRRAGEHAHLVPYAPTPKGNPRGKNYYVRIKGERVTYGPYTLKSAKDFARIGSQFGSTRYVRRGTGTGPRVRTYTSGERRWPVRESQLGGLLPSERPRRLN